MFTAQGQLPCATADTLEACTGFQPETLKGIVGTCSATFAVSAGSCWIWWWATASRYLRRSGLWSSLWPWDWPCTQQQPVHSWQQQHDSRGWGSNPQSRAHEAPQMTHFALYLTKLSPLPCRADKM